MKKKRPYICSECGHIGQQEIIEVDPPQTITVTDCSPKGCPFHRFDPLHYCAITKSELYTGGEFPSDCPVNLKVIRVSTAEVNY